MDWNGWITNQKLQKKKGKETPFTSASKRIKYLAIHLIKVIKDLYLGNYKTLMKETEDTNKWKDIPFSGIERIILLKSLDFISGLKNY